ncbi:hypothetical protein OF83DRAFT_1174786 [Amylostereum chailletii]|nr:hypothetical protein OF83DRAFT_1174786 [Amylostereum chailletii]
MFLLRKPFLILSAKVYLLAFVFVTVFIPYPPLQCPECCAAGDEGIMRQASDNSGSDVEIEDIDFEDLDGEQVQLVVRCIDDPNTTFEYPRPRFLVWMAK